MNYSGNHILDEYDKRVNQEDAPILKNCSWCGNDHTERGEYIEIHRADRDDYHIISEICDECEEADDYQEHKERQAIKEKDFDLFETLSTIFKPL